MSEVNQIVEKFEKLFAKADIQTSSRSFNHFKVLIPNGVKYFNQRKDIVLLTLFQDARINDVEMFLGVGFDETNPDVVKAVAFHGYANVTFKDPSIIKEVTPPIYWSTHFDNVVDGGDFAEMVFKKISTDFSEISTLRNPKL